MSRELPARPNLEHLKKQAKELLGNFRRGEIAAKELFRSLASLSPNAEPKLADAQHLIAREYGFTSWTKLKEQVELLSGDPHTAFSAAVRSGNVKQAGQLLTANPQLKAKLNAPLQNYGFGQNALHCAVHRADREMIELLLRAGADINKRSEWWAGSFGVLDDAWRAPWLPQFLLERGAKLDVNSAARLGMFKELKAMIEANPELVHARGGDGQTPLHVTRSVEIAEYLVEHGADIDALDVDHESTPAQYLVRDAQDVVRYLIKRGCKTDILQAAALGDLELVRKFLDADPETIHAAVNAKFFPMKNARAGGTVYIWTLGQNKMAHQLAREFGHEAVFALVMERSPEGLRLALAYELGDEETVRAILARNPMAAKSLSADEQARFVAAAMDSNTRAVRLMLAAGWPPGTVDRGGVTALHWAGFHGIAEMTQEILRYKPPLEGRDKEFDATPLRWAIYGSVHGWHPERGDYAGTVEAMLKAGAKMPPTELRREASEAVLEVLRRYTYK